MTTLRLVAVALSCAAAPCILAQQRQPSPGAFSTEALRIPVHSGTEAHAAGYGTWAAGPGFKASFHDGFAFYPELGPSYPDNLPLRWHTTAVSVGGEALAVSPAPRLGSSDWQVTMAHDGFCEVYDVRADGVEQSFVVDAPPATGGDLVIRGQVTTELSSQPIGRTHGPLVFRDAAGRPILQYGGAFAIDATGRRSAALTTFDGDAILLTVPAAWLLDARFPVTVDPLTSSLVLSQASSAAIGTTDVCTRPAAPASRNTMTTYSRIFSGGDHDVFAVLSDTDFQNPLPVFSDVTPVYTDGVTVTFVRGTADRWIIAFESGPGIDAYFHDMASLVLNSGARSRLTTDGREPRLGGTRDASSAANTGAIVFSRAFLSTFQVWGARVDALTRQMNSEYELGTPVAHSGYRREAAAITQIDQNTAGWLVVWQERDLQVPGSRFYVAGALITGSGPWTSRILVIDPAADLVQPMVGGQTPNAVVTHVRSQGLTASLRAQRVVWALNPPAQGTARTVLSWATPATTVVNRGLAYDLSSGAFVAATYTRETIGRPSTTSAHIARLSLNGATINAETLYSVAGLSAVSASVTYDPLQRVFPAVFGSNDSNLSLAGRDLTYPLGAVVPYGTACGAATIDAHPPLAGNRLFAIELAQAPAGTPVGLYVSLGAGALPLDPFGLTGCTMLLDPAQLLGGLSGFTNSNGRANVLVPLPDSPALTGDLYFQFLYPSPLANPAELQTTQGLLTQIR